MGHRSLRFLIALLGWNGEGYGCITAFMKAANLRTVNPWLILAGLIALCLAVGAIGGLVTEEAVVTWYPTLTKPSWTPPSRLFGPVWTTLYILMAIAAWLVWKGNQQHPGAWPALTLFFIQLALNFLWSPLFFGLRSPALGLIDIAALLIVLIPTIIAFFRQSLWAGLLLLPYLAWAAYASALNYAIWRMN
jgi:benzodiazapine receptor